MNEEILRVGMVGLGMVARAHVKGYESHPMARLAAVCDLAEEQAKRFAADHGNADVYTSYEEMIKEADLDVVDIGTPTFMHIPVAVAAAKAGKHVHCEKPFCRSIGEGLEACRAAAENGVKIVVGETYVFHASHVKARELIEAGEIGKPLQIRQRKASWKRKGQRRQPSRRQNATEGWRGDAEQSGGGDYPWVFDHAVHFFAAAEYFMLDLAITEVYSVPGTRRIQPDSELSQASTSVPRLDVPIITFRFEDSDCQGVWTSAEKQSGKFDFMHGFSTQIVGEKGMIEVLGEGGGNLIWNGQQEHLVLHLEGKETQCFRFDEGGDDIWDSDIAYYSQGHINQIHHLIECILKDEDPRYTGEDGTHAVACTLAAIHSAREGRPVKLEEIDESYTAF